MINKKAKAIKKTVIKSRIMFENHKDSLFNNKIILLNLIENQQDIDKIYLYAKDPYEAKYQFLIKKKERTGPKHFNTLKLLLSIQMIRMMFTKILMNTIQIKNVQY